MSIAWASPPPPPLDTRLVLASGCAGLLTPIFSCQVLGVRARDTGRATNQAAFIKAGCPEATITITLWNEGPEAYAPDIFGTEIIIERRIGKTASYAIKTAHGRKIGHRREDLDAVLEALQINAANPITVMTQVGHCLISLPS